MPYGRTYLLGANANLDLFVVRIAANSAEPEAYASLGPAEMHWNGATAQGVGAGFGSAFTYDVSGETPRVFFASNGGAGLFELALPIVVDASCWNTGTDTSGHAACDTSSFHLTWRTGSATTAYNDGMVCPKTAAPFSDTFVPTRAPTAAQTAAPTAHTCEHGSAWFGGGVGEDCETACANLGFTCSVEELSLNNDDVDGGRHVRRERRHAPR